MNSHFGQKPYKPKHNQRNTGGDGRERKLNMKREKYFRFDLDDLLVQYELGENKSIIAATILNKLTRQSVDDAAEYVNRVREAGTLTPEAAETVKALLQRYSKWR